MPDSDKRTSIMQAAEKLFAARRFHEITTDNIAHLARVGKGTIYRYFRDKDDLPERARALETIVEVFRTGAAGPAGVDEKKHAVSGVQT